MRRIVIVAVLVLAGCGGNAGCGCRPASGDAGGAAVNSGVILRDLWADEMDRRKGGQDDR